MIDSLLLCKTDVSKTQGCFIIFCLLLCCFLFLWTNMEDSLPDWFESLLVIVLLHH